MRADLASLLDDLDAEEQDLRDLLSRVDDRGWSRPTPAAGWTVRDQLAHLAESEELAALALHDEAAFVEHLSGLLADLDGALAAMEARGRSGPVAQLLWRWETARRRTLEGLRARAGDDRIPWVMGPMSCVSFATARLMETWAHGHDVADALGVRRPATSRLRHVAHLGVATRAFSFANRGLAVPPAPRVELVGPAGERWGWGPADAVERVTGPAEDFCLVVTQRRNPADTELVAVGDGARRWLTVAQAFAGPPTDGRAPIRRPG